MGDAFALAAFKHAMHDVDRRRTGQMRAQRDAFVEMGDEKLETSRGEQRRPDPAGPQPVCVRLDDAAAARRGETSAQEVVVGGQRAEIDGENRAGRVMPVFVGRFGPKRVIVHGMRVAPRTAEGKSCRLRQAKSQE